MTAPARPPGPDLPAAADSTDLAERFRAGLAKAEWPKEAPAVVVGVSGGLDSMTLLHLFLRLRRGARRRPAFPEIVAAHLDHRMSPGSAAVAQWVEDTCEEWGVPCRTGAVPSPPRSEAEGRSLRYRFFEEARREAGPGAVAATGHTADDQAETVLFRIARGAGPRGMTAVLPERPPGVVRPLLPFWRRELAAYAAEHRIPFREDPTNRDLRWTRNRLRHEVLPALEDAVPGAASALAALAGASRTHVEALDHLLDDQIAALGARGTSASRATDSTSHLLDDQIAALAARARSSSPAPAPPAGACPEPMARPAPVPPNGFDLDHQRLLALPDAVVAQALRRAVLRLGGRLGRAATRDLLRFAKESQSGRRISVPGGVTVTRDLDCLRIEVGDPPAASLEHPAVQEVVVAGGKGEGRFAKGRLEVHAAWGPAPPADFPFVAPFVPGEVRFPLAVRPWRPGDRIEARCGKKKVKKLLLEARIPTDRRTGYPVLADATGKLLWVPGAADPELPPPAGAPRWVGVRIRDLADARAKPAPSSAPDPQCPPDASGAASFRPAAQ